MRSSVERLTDLLGRPPRYLAYPYGRATAAAAAEAARLGLRGAFGLDRPLGPFGDFALRRVPIVPADARPLFALKTAGRYVAWRQSAPVRAVYTRGPARRSQPLALALVARAGARAGPPGARRRRAAHGARTYAASPAGRRAGVPRRSPPGAAPSRSPAPACSAPRPCRSRARGSRAPAPPRPARAAAPARASTGEARGCTPGTTSAGRRRRARPRWRAATWSPAWSTDRTPANSVACAACDLAEQLAGAGSARTSVTPVSAYCCSLPRDRLREEIRVVAVRDEAQRSDLARELAGLAQRPADVGGRPPAGRLGVEPLRQVEVRARAVAPDVRGERRDPGGEVIERPCREAARAHELARVDRGRVVEHGAVVVGERPPDGPAVPAGGPPRTGGSRPPSRRPRSRRRGRRAHARRPA